MRPPEWKGGDLMQLDEISEGLAHYALTREEVDARTDMIRWSVHVADPCCRECGFLTYARQELRSALCPSARPRGRRVQGAAW